MMLMYVLSNIVLLRAYIMKGFCFFFFQRTFLCLLKWSCDFCLWSPFIWLITFINLSKLNQPCNSGWSQLEHSKYFLCTPVFYSFSSFETRSVCIAQACFKLMVILLPQPLELWCKDKPEIVSLMKTSYLCA